MKTILLLRHAKSSWHDARLNDHERPLSGRGERAAKAMADYVAHKVPRPDLILCSTSTRTRQTLAPVIRELGPPTPPISLESTLYLASDAILLAQLRKVPESVSTVLLVGHNDGIADLARALAGGGAPGALATLSEKFPTGALAVLKLKDRPWDDLEPGAAELVDFVRPRDLSVT
ncbi:MAG: SixA phosphatase family protein [Pseudomonadota bacterium]